MQVTGLDKYVRAQQCAMKTLADMAVFGLDAAVHQGIQDFFFFFFFLGGHPT